MRPWSSLALLAVVLIKWISGAHVTRLFCLQPENYKLCRILMEHNVAINKRFLRFGRNFGEPFLRFGRSDADDDDINKRLGSFEDKAYLRFGRGADVDELTSILLRGPANYNGWQYRRKRASGNSVNVAGKSRRRRSVEEASPATGDNFKRSVSQGDILEPSLGGLGHVATKRQTYFPRFGRPDERNDAKDNDLGSYEERLMRYARNGWLHFGKRVSES